jgi:putative thioredoxin
VVDSYNGALKLAKVNTDEQAQLAGAFGIKSLPTVVLVKDGQMLDGFMGALPESAVREFLSRHLEDAALEDEPVMEPEVIPESADQAVARLRAEIAANTDKPELQLDLALALMQAGDIKAAEIELDSLPANLTQDAKAKRLRAHLDLAAALIDAPPIAELRTRLQRDPADYSARDLLGVRLLLDGESAPALDEFLQILKAQRDWNDGLAKKRLIAAFNVLDDEDLVGTYRRKMASLLF